MEKTIKSVDGTGIFYNINRHSQDFIMFVHGLGSTSKYWEDEAELFHKLGISTVIPDLRGHGLSGKPSDPKKYSLKYFVGDLHSIITEEKLGSLTFIGTSFGSIVSVGYYKKHKGNVKSLVIINPESRVPLKVKLLLKIKPILRLIKSTKLAENEKLDFFITEVADYCINNFDEAAKEDRHKKMKFYYGIKVPVLFIKSGKDRIVPKRDVERVCSMIRGAEVVNFEKGHHPLVREMPVETGKSIIDFLQARHLITHVSAIKALSVLLLAFAIALFSTPSLLSSLLNGGITGASIGVAESGSIQFAKPFFFRAVVSALLVFLFLKLFSRKYTRIN